MDQSMSHRIFISHLFFRVGVCLEFICGHEHIGGTGRMIRADGGCI